MRRSHRISRGLIGLLGVVLTLGVVLWVNNVRKSNAAETAAAAPTTAQPSAPQATSASAAGQSGSGAGLSGPSVSKTSTPTLPTQQPRVNAPSNANPATRPTRMTQPIGLPAPADSNLPTITDATRRKSAGDLLGARRVLNDALLSARLSPSDTDAARRMLTEINQAVVFSPKHFAGDEFTAPHTVRGGELLRTIAEKNDTTWELLLRVNGMSDPRKLRAGQNIKLVRGPFHAVVSKSRYTLDVYLGSPGERGSMYVTTFNVGLGANDSTPTGSWLVEPHKKIKNPTYFSPRGEGVIDADDPKNPLGERWIGLVGTSGQAIGKQSYGIHGTIEPNSIGQQASMGCIRLKNEDVELVFDLLVEGKSVVVVKE